MWNVDRPQNQDIITIKDGNLPLDVVLDLLQPLQPVLDIQVNMSLQKMASNDFSWPTTMMVDTRIKSL